MTDKFIRKFNQAKTFDEWMTRLLRFDYSLIKDNNLQMWTKADYKKFWEYYKGVKV